MVLLNYQSYIKQQVQIVSNTVNNPKAKKSCQSQSFLNLLVKMYEYCQEINIIEHRMKILAKETQMIKGIKPKLLDSQIYKVKQKTKQISSAYSIFLFQQPKFKVASEQARFYEIVIQALTEVLQSCFKAQDFIHLKKQINRLFRTNSFNMQLSWPQFLQHQQGKLPVNSKKRKFKETDYKNFRKSVLKQSSEIRPYVNNKSIFQSQFTRSPVVSLMYPTKQYLTFNLKKQQSQRMKQVK